MLSCRVVRVSAIWRTSASEALYSGDPNAGCGAGRNCELEARKNGFACPSVANAGGVGVAFQQAAHIGTVPVNGSKNRSVLARAITLAATLRPTVSPVANRSGPPAGDVGDISCWSTSPSRNVASAG